MNQKRTTELIVPINLRCEYLIDPLGVDTLRPRFSWTLESAVRGACQTGYQIVVSSTSERLNRNNGDRWDSGKADSDRLANVAYEGEELESGETCYWKVRAWDLDNNPGPWSDVCVFR